MDGGVAPDQLVFLNEIISYNLIRRLIYLHKQIIFVIMGCSSSSSELVVAPTQIFTQNNQDLLGNQPHHNSTLNNSKQHEVTNTLMSIMAFQGSMLTFEELGRKIQNSLLLKTNHFKNGIPKELILAVLQKYNLLYYSDANASLLFKTIIDFLKTSLDPENFNTKKASRSLTTKFAEQTYKLENLTHFKQKNTLKIWGSLKNDFIQIKSGSKIKRESFLDLDFQMRFEEIVGLAKKLRSLCQWDINAFMLLSNYLVASTYKMHQKQVDLEVVQSKVVELLSKLQEIYPPAPAIEKSALTDKIKTVIKKIPLDKRKSINLSQFQANEKIEKLQEFIMERAKEAGQNYKKFIELTEQHCTKKGFHYLTGVKIKNISQRSAIERVKQKILRKTIQFKSFKKLTVQLWKKSSQFIADSSLEGYLKAVDQNYQMQMTEIYKKLEGSVDFLVTDMLRGKCMFDQISDINETASNIIAEANNKGYEVIEVDNKLNGMTSDLVLKILIGETVTELQLVVNFNLVQNQFSHKIYEIYRSQFFGELKMLMMFNKHFSNSYLNEVDAMVGKAEKMSENDQDKLFQEEETFASLKQYIQNYKKQLEVGENSTAMKPTVIATNFWAETSEIFKQMQSTAPNQSNQTENHQVIQIHQAKFYQDRHQFQKSIEFYEKATKSMSQQKSDEEILRYGIISSELGQIYNDLGKYSEALKYYNESLEIRGKFQGKDSHNYSSVLHSIGSVYFDQQNYSQALSHYEQSLRISQALNGIDSIPYIDTLVCIGLVYSKQNNFEKALNNYQQCLTVYQKIKGKDSHSCALSLNNIGVLYYRQNNFPQALKYYHRTLQIYQKITGSNGLKCADVLNNIGSVHFREKNYAEALQNYNKSLEIYEKIQGKNSVNSALLLSNIGIVYVIQNNFSEGLKYYNQSLNIYTQIKGKNSIDCANVLSKIGNLYKENGNYRESLKNYSECLNITEICKGKDSPDYASIIKTIGFLYYKQCKYLQAIENYKKSLQIYERINGKDSLDCAIVNRDIGLCWEKDNGYEEAIQSFERSQAIYLKIYGSGSQQVELLVADIQRMNQTLFQ